MNYKILYLSKVDFKIFDKLFYPDLKKSRFELSIFDDDSIKAVALTCANIVSDS